MFYVKEKLPDDGELKVFINDENVFTACPVCGKEHSVDISEIFKDGETDLFGTAIYCSECAVKFGCNETQ